jgi:hypothetical protein
MVFRVLPVVAIFTYGFQSFTCCCYIYLWFSEFYLLLLYLLMVFRVLPVVAIFTYGYQSFTWTLI